jgi:predicted alpha/beta-fold hydrolase
MRNWLIIFSVLFLGILEAIQAIEESDQSNQVESHEYYNEINFDFSFLTSLKSGIIVPDKSFNQCQGSIQLFPERLSCGAISNNKLVRKTIDFKYKLQVNTNSPLLIIVPGTGGDSYSSMAQYFAMLAYQAGYSVVELVSTTNSAFSLAASRSGRVGYLPNDAEDYYNLLVAVKAKILNLEKKNGLLALNPSSIGLLGYSYGGIDIGFLLAEDQKQKIFNFDFAVMLNVPFSRNYAIEKVDEYDQSFKTVKHLQLEISELVEGLANPLSYLINHITHQLYGVNHYFEALLVGLEHRSITIPKLPARLEDFIPMSTNQGGKLIAIAFRSDIGESAFASDLIEYCNLKSANPQLNLELPKPENALVGSIQKYLKSGPFRGANNSIDLENALDKVYINYSERVKNRQVAKPQIRIFHAKDDYLTFGQNSPAERIMQKWQSMLPGYIEITGLSNTGGHMGEFADDNVIRNLYKTLLAFKK